MEKICKNCGNNSGIEAFTGNIKCLSSGLMAKTEPSVNEDTGEVLSGSSGLHIYVLVKNGNDIHRYGGVLAKRAWLKGYGQMIILDHGGGYYTLYGYLFKM